MKKEFKQSAVFAATFLMTAATGFAADDIIFGNLGPDYTVAYDVEAHLLIVLGDDNDNHIEVCPGDDGSVLINRQAVAVGGRVLFFKEFPTVAIHGGAGDDVLIGHRLPVLALGGGRGDDTLVWDNGGFQFDADRYAGDLVFWSAAGDGDGRVYGGAGLDVLIGNTSGDRDAVFGDLGNDWIVGGTGVDSSIGSFGNDYLAGGADTDASYGGWGNDLLNADDVITEQEVAGYSPNFSGGVRVAAGDIN